MTADFVVCDCTPMMADVVSGAVPHPREKRPHESARAWMLKTPTWQRLAADYPGADIQPAPDAQPTREVSADEFPHVFTLTADGQTQAVYVNVDGTRFALVRQFNLREWQTARGLTTRELTDYLNGLGCDLSVRTVEGYHRLGCPAWLPPLLRQRDALNQIYALFGPLHDAVVRTANGLVYPDTVDPAEAINQAGALCDNLERLFERFLTERERGETED